MVTAKRLLDALERSLKLLFVGTTVEEQQDCSVYFPGATVVGTQADDGELARLRSVFPERSFYSSKDFVSFQPHGYFDGAFCFSVFTVPEQARASGDSLALLAKAREAIETLAKHVSPGGSLIIVNSLCEPALVKEISDNFYVPKNAKGHPNFMPVVYPDGKVSELREAKHVPYAYIRRSEDYSVRQRLEKVDLQAPYTGYEKGLHRTCKSN